MFKSVFAGRFAVVMSVALSGVLMAADIAPAPANYSDPKAAMKSFLRAPDKAALLDALVIAPADRGDVEAFIDVMDQTTQLQKAATADFGAGAAKYFSDVTGAELDAKLKSIDTAQVSIEGDKATVTMPSDEAARQAAATVNLRKIGANWKIEAASLFGITDASKADTQHRVEIAHKIATITQQMIVDIKARKFTSASDAYQEYWNRSRGALRDLATTAPAGSQPAARP